MGVSHSRPSETTFYKSGIRDTLLMRPPKKRPRSAVIADMSVNFLERQVLRRGHRLLRIPAEADYGTDAIMFTHNPVTTSTEPGHVQFQLKATDHPEFVDNEQSVACRVETCHLHDWIWKTYYPFILVLYDAGQHRAFWLDVKRWADEDRGEYNKCREKGQQTLTLHIPVNNRLTPMAIDRFRSALLASIPKNTNDE